MIIIRFVFAMTLLGVTLSSCQVLECGADKNAFLNKYESFIAKVDHLDLDVSSEKWSKYDAQFKTYIEDCYDYYEDDLTTKERRQFWMKTLKYYATRYGEGMINELSKKDGISEKVEKNIEEVLDATGRDLEDFINKNMNEIEDLVKDIGKDIEDWAAKLKDILQE
ncbi:MAG: hypothetical protein KDC53_11450 [Saprospiraceae bacterium]|nr:hypothetical protein [Saprospiraceae bacterium]